MDRSPTFRIFDAYYNYITEGFKEAAEKFRMESGIQPSIDLDQLDERIRIREAIQTGKIEEAISLVNNLYPELLDNDRYLYFHLQVELLLYICPLIARRLKTSSVAVPVPG